MLTIELAKKFFVTFELCLLTFSVYIGSAIYSAGEMDVESVFQVSEASATLGLTMFVLGYGTGTSFILEHAQFTANYHPANLLRPSHLRTNV